MKKILCLVVCMLFFAGCGRFIKTENTAEVKLPFEDTIEMTFSSGAGGWGTSIYLKNDGTFSGGYHDSEMGDIGDDYPNGTVYICDFEGKFKVAEKIDDYSYRLIIEKLETKEETDTEWIDEGVRYHASEAHGIAGGKEFIFYTPDMSVSELDEEFLSWWPGRFITLTSSSLNEYGLYNKNEGSGFFTQDFMWE